MSNSKRKEKMKDRFTLFHALERKIWGEKIHANPYFATISIFAAALAGALFGGGRLFYEWFDWDVAVGNVAAAAFVVVVWGYDVAESIIACESWKAALGRSALLLPVLVLAFVIGAVVSVVVIVVVVVVLAVWFMALFAGQALKGSGGRSSGRSSGPDQFGYDENGSACKLEVTGGGYARDDYGRRWRNDGGTKWHLDE